MNNNHTFPIGITFNPYGMTYARYGNKKFFTIKAHGYSAVDYNMANTETELYTMSLPDAEQKMYAERAEAKAAGIQISQVHGPWRWPPQDATAEMRQERMEKMKRSILLTRFLGCKNWVVHPIMPYGVEEAGTALAAQTWALNLEFMSELLAYAKEQDVTICLENMPMLRFSMSKPAQIREFVDAIQDDHFKICLDTGHVAVFPELPLGDAVRELGDRIRVLHVHDNMGDRDAHLWPTQGIINWPEFVCALRDIRYPGIFSLEAAPKGDCDHAQFEAQSVALYQIAQKIITED